MVIFSVTRKSGWRVCPCNTAFVYKRNDFTGEGSTTVKKEIRELGPPYLCAGTNSGTWLTLLPCYLEIFRIFLTLFIFVSFFPAVFPRYQVVFAVLLDYHRAASEYNKIKGGPRVFPCFFRKKYFL